MYAPDESGDAHYALEIDLDNVEWLRVVAVGLCELKRQLVGEGGLAGVAWSEERDE